MEKGTTRYAGWGKKGALRALAVAAVLVGACLVVTLRSATLPVNLTGSQTDVDLFRHVVQKVHAGLSPYDAFQQVFEEYNYPLKSALNYRPPLLFWSLGHLPDPRWGEVVLEGLCLATILLAFEVVRREGSFLQAGTCAVLLVFTFSYCLVNEIDLYAEMWAGTLILLSVCSYALRRPKLGFAVGLLALFCRELTLPYCVSAAAIAAWKGRRREAVAWVLGLALYGVYLGLHLRAVMPRLHLASGVINGNGWVHFGGLRFILVTCRVNPLLIISPPWVAALYLPLALLGVVGWRGETSMRTAAALALFFVPFSVVGGMFNAYWGLMYAPLLPLGLVWAPASLKDLCAAAFRRADASKPDSDTGSATSVRRWTAEPVPSEASR